MSGQIVYLKGHAMYPRIFEDNRDMTGYEGAFEPYDGVYEIAVGVPDGGDDFKTIMGWNNRYEPKRLGDSDSFSEEKGAVAGLAYFRFRRKHTHKIRVGKPDEKIVREWGGPPKVVDKDGQPWDSSNSIGNGSVVVLKLHVGSSTQGRKTLTHVRLDGVMVLEHVAYKAPETDEPAAGAAPKVKGMPDDEIPF